MVDGEQVSRGIRSNTSPAWLWLALILPPIQPILPAPQAQAQVSVGPGSVRCRQRVWGTFPEAGMSRSFGPRTILMRRRDQQW
jgi:hypothetical protein